MKRNAKFAFILLINFLCFLYTYDAQAQLTSAQTPAWVRIPKNKPIKLNLDDISAGYYYDLLDYQVNLSNNTRYYKEIKVIFDQIGVENTGQIQVHFDPKFQKLILHELKIIRDNKQINLLNLNKFKMIASENDLARFVYNGSYMAYCVLDDLRKDDQILFSYSVAGFNPVFENKFFDEYYLQTYEPVGLVHVNIVVPQNRKLNFKSFNQAPSAKKEIGKNEDNFYWEFADSTKINYEDYTPAWYNNVKKIQCSEFNSWREVQLWLTEINPIRRLKAGTPLSNYVEKIWQDSKGRPYEFLKTAVDFVQNEVRYMGVEMGEYSHRANDPENVFLQRYGDCKDKSLLLASILQQKNIDSQLVLANIYRDRGLEENLPSPSVFNHMVVLVTIDGRQQMIDPTMTYQGGEIKDRYFPPFGKVLTTKFYGLTDIPQKVFGNIKIKETITLQGDFEAILAVQTVYKGNDADNIRAYFKSNSKKSIEKSYLEYYAKIFPKISKLETIQFMDDMENNIVEVVESYQVKDVGKRSNSREKKYIGVYGTHIYEKLPEILDSRTAPITLSYPLDIEYEINIVNKGKHSFSPSKGNQFIDRVAYVYGKNINVTTDTLKISYVLGFHEPYVEQVNVKQYYDDFSDRENMFFNAFYLDDNGYVSDDTVTVSQITSANEINWGIVFIFLFASSALVFLTVHYYNKKSPNILLPYEEPSYNQIGGWLFVLAIVTIIAILRLAYGLFMDSSPINRTLWEAMDTEPHSFAYKTLLLFEFLSNTFLLFGFTYSFILLIKKRNLFGQTFFVVILFQLVFQTFDLVFSYIYLKAYITQNMNMYAFEFFKTVIFTSIWGTYVYQSERVKGTCVIPYLGHTVDVVHPFTETEMNDHEHDEEDL